MGANYDFSGWATRNDLRCSDGRTIRKGAFIANDGATVPLVWNHQHNSAENVLGHAILENRDEGVYAYCSFNDTDNGKRAKEFVRHGDVAALSIYANNLKQRGGDVLHGVIREVSLVLAGANPGAFIDAVLEHGEYSDEEAIIYTGEPIALAHADQAPATQAKAAPADNASANSGSGETVKDVFDTLSDKQKQVVYFLIGQAVEDAKKGNAQGTAAHSALEHAAADTVDDPNETVQDVFDTLTDKQKNVVYALIGQALQDAGAVEGGNATVKHNIFDTDEVKSENVLAHGEMLSIFADAKNQYGSLKQSFLQHGIEDIEYLFPDAVNLDKTPQWIKRPDEWVSKVMGGTHHTPFSRIKSLFADITEDEARARGYLSTYTRDAKGNKVDANGNPAYKKEEVFSLLKRTTTPTTIYKKQKLDRDDIVDITDFDVVAWLKTEMRGMLDEEIARAILIGDGRPNSSDDKINELNIRPIVSDDELFTIKYGVTVPTGGDRFREIIKCANRARKNYRGSGSPTFFTTEDTLIEMLLIEDTNQHRLYKDAGELASAMRVSSIVTVPVMEGLTTPIKQADGTSVDQSVIGIIVNLTDYNVGADKGGSVNMFDDFDIDYNAQKYLIETRCSGALVKPYSAITLYDKTTA